MNAHALEVRALRARVAALEAELARHTLHSSDARERHLHTAAMASHEHATDVHLLKQRHATQISSIEQDNAALRKEVDHRRRQLHGAVTRLGALKQRLEEAHHQNATLRAGAKESAAAAVARRRRAKSAAAARRAKHDGLVTLLGAQDSMLHLVQTLSHLSLIHI